MDCKRARKNLETLALSGAMSANSPELATHLAACSECGEAFAREQEFVAAMDRSLAATVAGEPSPALRARVREQLAALPRGWEWRWAVVAAAALLAVGISLHALHSRRAQPGQNLSSPGGEIAAKTPVAPLPNSGQGATTRRATSSIRKRAEHESAALPNLPTVLIEKGEREATLRFVAGVRDGRVDPVPLTAQKGTREVAQLEIKPLELPALAEAHSSPGEGSAP